MCNRQFWAGLLVGVNVSALGFGGVFLANRPKNATEQSDPNEEFVEVRFRVAKSNMPAAERKFHNQGVLQNSGNPFDIAIEGEGFYQVQMPNGQIRYTRQCRFEVNAKGSLVTMEGHLVHPEIKLPDDTLTLSVGADGAVSVVTASHNTIAICIAGIEIAKFQNPGGLARDEFGYLTETTESGPPTFGGPGLNGFGFLRQGFTENNQDLMIANIFQSMSSLAAQGMGTAIKARLNGK